MPFRFKEALRFAQAEQGLICLFFLGKERFEHFERWNLRLILAILNWMLMKQRCFDWTDAGFAWNDAALFHNARRKSTRISLRKKKLLRNSTSYLIQKSYQKLKFTIQLLPYLERVSSMHHKIAWIFARMGKTILQLIEFL